MSFVHINENTGKVYAAGYFLADPEHCTRETRTIKADDKSVITADNGGKYVPMGATYKVAGTGESAADVVVGVVFADVDVTDGDAAGSVVTSGTIIKDRLVKPDDAAALKAIGFTVLDTADDVVRPE